MSQARTYFGRYVLPSLSAWRAQPDNIVLATALANRMNNLADRLARHDKGGRATRKETNSLRLSLAYACPEYGIIRDVADSEKHEELVRGNRRITIHSQTEETGGFDNARIIVTEDNGTKHEFEDVVDTVFPFLEAELAKRRI